jgi:bacterioferritin-associated ferredoxin
MIICVCKAVSERHIRSAVKNGATSVRDLTRELGVGTCCGKCIPEARATLSTSLDAQNASSGHSSPMYFPGRNTEVAA